jgi:hypothetical protein
MKIRSMPCEACPYRRDVPSGLWAKHEYEKLRGYDNATAYQPPGPFSCHATPEFHCHGWAVVHGRQTGEHDLLAFRMYPPEGEIPPPGVPLFESGNEAADHGERDIENPGPEAIAVVDRLTRKYDRLEYG